MRAFPCCSALVVVALCGLLGCSVDTVEPSSDEGGDTQVGTETETGDPAGCTEPDEAWETTQTYFWQLSTTWSDGERVLGHSHTRLLTFDGETTTWIANATTPTTLQEIEARDLDQAWLVRLDSVEYWDGETTHTTLTDLYAPDVEVAADGGAWLVAHPCEMDVCGSQLWRWQDDDRTWLELPLPDLPPVRSFWAGPDGELWLGTEDSFFAHRSPAGKWTIENVEDEGYEGWSHPNGWQNFPTFTADSLDVDADGHLWATDDFSERVSLVHRNPAGKWNFSANALIIAEEDQQQPSVVIADGEEALVFRRGAERALRRFTPPGYLNEVASISTLGVDPLTAVVGTSQRLVLLSSGPKITAIDPSADPIEPERLVDIVSVPPFRTSAPSVDAPVSARGRALVRFDGQQWAEILRIPDNPTGSVIIDVFADSADSGWLIAGEDPAYDPNHGRRLWRWQGQEATPTAIWVDGDDQLRWLWGTAPDRVWLAGIYGGKATIWKYDGEQWGGAWQGGGELVAVAGDDESVFFFDDNGSVLGWEGPEWRDLGSVLPDEPGQLLEGLYYDGDRFARVGDELLLRVMGYYSSYHDVLMRWDGETWSPAEGLPPLERLTNDAQGRAWAIGEGKLYRHDGLGPADAGWEEIALDHVDDDTLLTASADGVVVRSPWFTSVFRYTCDSRSSTASAR